MWPIALALPLLVKEGATLSPWEIIMSLAKLPAIAQAQIYFSTVRGRGHGRLAVETKTIGWKAIEAPLNFSKLRGSFILGTAR